jgi:hypothetical protein
MNEDGMFTRACGAIISVLVLSSLMSHGSQKLCEFGV